MSAIPCAKKFSRRQDLRLSEAIETLVLIWEASEAEEWVNRLCPVPGLATLEIGGSTYSRTIDKGNPIANL
jgi:hypothetical protein